MREDMQFFSTQQEALRNQLAKAHDEMASLKRERDDLQKTKETLMRDTEEERRLAEFNAGSQAVKESLDGSGYIERDTDPKAKLIPDEYAAVKGRKVSKEIAAYYKAQKEAGEA